MNDIMNLSVPSFGKRVVGEGLQLKWTTKVSPESFSYTDFMRISKGLKYMVKQNQSDRIQERVSYFINKEDFVQAMNSSAGEEDKRLNISLDMFSELNYDRSFASGLSLTTPYDDDNFRITFIFVPNYEFDQGSYTPKFDSDCKNSFRFYGQALKTGLCRQIISNQLHIPIISP